MLDIKEGDFFEGYEVIVNPVNCNGSSSYGAAIMIAEKYPANQDLYELHCKVPDKHKDKLKVGNIYFTFHILSHEPYKFLFIVNMGIRNEEKDKLNMDHIEKALKQLADFIAVPTNKIKSVAIPAIEGVDFQKFYQLCAEKLGGLECKIDVFKTI